MVSVYMQWDIFQLTELRIFQEELYDLHDHVSRVLGVEEDRVERGCAHGRA